MKRFAIVVLMCVNVALVGALVARTLPQADAQARTAVAAPPPNYLMMTGHMRFNEDAVYVLDVNTRMLAAWEFDHATKRLERVRLMRNLATDFIK